MGSEEVRTPGTASAVVVGSPVWAEDPEIAWIEATVIKVDGDNVTARTINGDLVETTVANILPRDEDVTMRGVDDMTKLSYLHEPGVLHNLYTRYKHDEIYTYTGNILIAVNPFTRLPHLFNVYMMKQYKDAQPGDLNPHVYAVADAAYKAMMEDNTSQSILVSGESGAGKTETTKQIMQYLAFMGGRSGGEGRSVERQVLQSNPLLEAFGNAKTVRNNNSSRFGKFVEIQFNKGKISGAAVRTYLLERSRVTQISTPERNYHCFYQLVAGASEEDADRLKLGPPQSFHYLNQSKCTEVGTIDDCKEYQLTREAMDVVGISTEDQEAIFRTIAGVLHLGNIEFSSGKSEVSEVSTEKAKFHLQAAAEMLMCNEEMLEKSLTTRIMTTRSESITRLLDENQATDNRDALARTIYAKLFDWLVDKVNKSIGQDPQSTVLVGVLDIYGFESFDINSFEQFCINLTNEKLQQHFNTHVFKMEQAEYRKEEINWDDIDFVDNIDVLDLIEKKPVGIIALLDEACMLPRSTPESFASKLGSTFQRHKRFSRPKFKRTAFTIDHYAGQVEYQADFFLEKNKDYVVPEHQKLLHASKCPFVSGLFPPDEGTKAPSKFSSIGSRFKLQLASLMETLKLTTPHYIRCVKPNMQLKPQLFENKNVLQQLRCSGVLEAVRISCAGFPTRRTFGEFLDRFGLLYPEVLLESDEKVACQSLLDKCDLQGYQLGKTKVFLRAGQLAILDTKRSTVLNEAAVKIQRMVQSFLMHRDYRRMRTASLLVQAFWRGTMARLEFKFLREQAAAICFQRYIRGYLVQKSYMQMKEAAIKIQCAVRSLASRKVLCVLQENYSATQIQAKWRSHVACKSYNELLGSCLVFQGAWRCKEARGELKKLRQAARETGALREAKNRLEKKCEELTLRYELEKRVRMDLENAKNNEVAKLQAVIEEMQSQAEEMKMKFAKEHEAHEATLAQLQNSEAKLSAARTSSQPSQEALGQIESLTKEKEELQKLAEAREKELAMKVEELQEKKVLAERSAKSIREAESRLDKMQDVLGRMEEQVQNLQSENQILRQQALNMKALQSEHSMKEQADNIKALEAENVALKRRVKALDAEIVVIREQVAQPSTKVVPRPIEVNHDIPNGLPPADKLVTEFSQVTPVTPEQKRRWPEATDSDQAEPREETRDSRKAFRQDTGLGQAEQSRTVLDALYRQEEGWKELGTEASSGYRLGPSTGSTVVEVKTQDARVVPSSSNGLEASDADAGMEKRMEARAELAGATTDIRQTQVMEPNGYSTAMDSREGPSQESLPLHRFGAGNAEQVAHAQTMQLNGSNVALDHGNEPNQQLQHLFRVDVGAVAQVTYAQRMEVNESTPAIDHRNEPSKESQPLFRVDVGATTPAMHTQMVQLNESSLAMDCRNEPSQESPPLVRVDAGATTQVTQAQMMQLNESSLVMGHRNEPSQASQPLFQVDVGPAMSVTHMQMMQPYRPAMDHRVGQSQESQPLLRADAEGAMPQTHMQVMQPYDASLVMDRRVAPIHGSRPMLWVDVGTTTPVTHAQVMQPYEPSPVIEQRIGASQEYRPLFRIESAPVGSILRQDYMRQDYRRLPPDSRVELRGQEPRGYELRMGLGDAGHALPGPRPEQRTGLPTGLRPSQTPEPVQPLQVQPVHPGDYPDRPKTPVAPEEPVPTEIATPRPLSKMGHIRRTSKEDSIRVYSPQESQVAESKPADQRNRRIMQDKLQSDQEALLSCVMQDVGFSNDHPVAAVMIFKSLLHWHSFEAERTNVFDRIINSIQTATESHADHNDVLAYWLSNTSTLLYLLQRTLKASGASGSAPQRRRNQTLFGRMTQGFRSQQPNYPNGMGPIGVDNVRQVEAKYPALLFKQQLTAYVEKIYGMVRDNLKKEITPLLGSCIQAPRAPRHPLGRRASPAPGQQVLSSHWGSIINSLLKLLNTLRGNKVPPYLVRKIFTQIFSFINVQLFNSLLLRRECCSFSNGEYIKAGLAQLEHWIYEAGEEYAGASWDELRYIRQAVGFLVIHQKPKKSLDEITHDLCPALSIQQLYRISTMYWDDKYGTHTVAPEVIINMRVLMTEDSNSAVSNSFLLDDDSGIPFSVDDISKSMPEVDLSEVYPPPLLKEIPSFRFLQPEKE